MLAGVIGVLGGCATTAGYEQVLDSWVGKPEVALIRQWGVPASSYQSGGTRFLTFTSDRTVLVPGTSPTYTSTQVGNQVRTKQSGGSDPYTIALKCVTTFEVVDERVRRWRWDGNDCKAKGR